MLIFGQCVRGRTQGEGGPVGMSRKRTWASLIVCSGVAVSFVAILAFALWWSQQGLRNTTSRNQSKPAAATEVRAEWTKEPVQPSAGSSEASNLHGDFSRPTLRPDPEMFGKPELIPLTPGAGVGSLSQPSLPIDPEKIQSQSPLFANPGGHGDLPTVPNAAWNSPLFPPSVPLSPKFHETGTVQNLPPPSS